MEKCRMQATAHCAAFSCARTIRPLRAEATSKRGVKEVPFAAEAPSNDIALAVPREETEQG
jgi:hypothetical protein